MCVCVCVCVCVLETNHTYLSLSLSLSVSELKVDISRPVRVSPTLAKLEQAKVFWKRLFPEREGEALPRTPAGSAPRCSEAPPTADQLLRSLQSLVPFHKISLRTVQMVVSVEMEAHAARPSLTLSVSAMTGALTLKNAARPAGASPTRHACPALSDSCAVCVCECVFLLIGPLIQLPSSYPQCTAADNQSVYFIYAARKSI